MTIRMTMGTNMVAVSKLLADVMMIAPNPEIEVKNSAITMATTARGHDVGQRRRQDDPSQNDGIGRNEGLADLDQRLRHRRHAEPRVDADRKYRHQEHHRDLDRKTQAEPQHEQRYQRHQRHGITGGDIDSDRGLDGAEAADDEADRDADDNGKPIAQQERPQAVEQRGPKLSRARELPKRLRDRARIGAEDRIDVAAEYFPSSQQHGERADGDDPTRKWAPGLRFGRRLRPRTVHDINHLVARASQFQSLGQLSLRRHSYQRHNIRAVSSPLGAQSS